MLSTNFFACRAAIHYDTLNEHDFSLHSTVPVSAAQIIVETSSSDKDHEPKDEPKKETKRSEPAEPKERVVTGSRDSTGG